MTGNFIFDTAVSGKDFIRRTEESELLGKIIYENGNAFIAEPHKAGKTSLINNVVSELKGKGLQILQVSVSFLDVRSPEEMYGKLIEAYIRAGKTTGLEIENGARWTPENVLQLRNELEQVSASKVITVIDEFQEILLCDDPGIPIRDFIQILQNATGFILCGSEVNTMMSMFKPGMFFGKFARRVKFSPVSEKVLADNCNKGFLYTGKVIERELLLEIINRLQCNLWHVRHFCAICDAASKGYITEPIVKECFEAFISVFDPQFRIITGSLTNFQLKLVKAILDGRKALNSSKTVDAYGLNSSANVNRLKEALCKKEIVTFDEKGKPEFLDPLYEYWLRNKFFEIKK